ncbi:MAG TPA: CocE/NonD family hydrolase [Methylomirabilota bacterium]|nr:CocE/NonD family hydrolase [Methylomirabilota bacterium]
MRTIENVFIPLSDGTRLAARIWLPDGEPSPPSPAILEYIPYRKRDGTRGRDDPMHGYFAESGYAAVRVDMRGSGESDGLMDDEYLPLEQADAVEVIAWIAAQPWCSGKVGMMGKSWGGFNCLQVAAHRPPALAAVLTVCSTDDRYADDIHFMGGCLLNDNHWWGAIMLAYQSRPPDPEIVGERWRSMWRERMEHLPFFPAIWAARPRRDAYWAQGSICEDFAAVTCPVMAVGGWADAYTNAVPRLLAGLTTPRLGIIGPWAHLYPHDGAPGPAIGFLQEAVRWWDHWLKGVDTGVMAEPMLRAYLEDWTPPATTRGDMPGRWVGEPVWPSPRIAPRTLHFGRSSLADTPQQGAAPVAIRSPAYCGAAAGEWMGVAIPGEAPADQRLDDGYSLIFDSDPLDGRLEILGAPEVTLALSSDKPQAQVAVRLSDVALDGAATRVSYAVLDLTHRDGHAVPKRLPVGREVTVTLRLNDCGHAFPAGHRIRIAVSTAYWPLVWPAPEAATLTIHPAASHLVLPVRPLRQEDADIAFGTPEAAPPTPQTVLEPGRLARIQALDLIADEARYRTVCEGGVFGEGAIRFDDIGTEIRHSLTRDLSIRGGDPNTALSVIDQEILMGRDGWRIAIATHTEMTSTPTHFRLTGTVTTTENGAHFVTRTFDETILRDDGEG